MKLPFSAADIEREAKRCDEYAHICDGESPADHWRTRAAMLRQAAAPSEVWVLLRCFGYSNHDVAVEAVFTSEAEAEAACESAPKKVDYSTPGDVNDSLRVEGPFTLPAPQQLPRL